MAMTTREFFIKQFAAERPKFVKVIRALPEGHLDYKPHERSSAAGAIAWFLVLELRALVDMVKNHENHWQQSPGPKTAAEIASEYEKAAGEMDALLKSTDEAAWARDTKMYVGDKLMKSAPLGETVWDFFLDAIHHRGQLTSYLRPMGGKVPSVYGPSGDAK
jgi:uncharacterized damage-inducible protein DinB